MRARSCAAAIAILLAAHAARGFALEGTWYVLVHFRDVASANPDALRWEDRVWDFQRQGERLLWTEYELVDFVDARGRFERDRRRVVGPWEPSRSQRREIRRGLFANPRGARVLALEQTDDGAWRTRSDPEALQRSRSVVSFGLAASIAWAGELPVFTIDEMLHRPGSVASLAHTVLTTRSAGDSGDQLSGDYARGSTRTGSFRMVPTSLRRRLNPHAAVTPTGIAMKPDSVADWANLLPALARPWHYFPQRSIRIETTPTGALLDLAYHRRGVRLMFEQVRAPLEVELPSRFVAHRGDALGIHAFVPGYEPARITAPVHGNTELLEIGLEPIANSVEIAGYRYLAGRGALALLTRAELDVRVSDAARELLLVLPGTALGEEAGRVLDSLRSPQLERVTAIQLGRDLLLQVRLTGEARDERPAFRIFTGFEIARQLHRTVLELSRPETRATRRALDCLAKIRPEAVSGCALRFDAALRKGLNPTDLARALTPSGGFIDPILRASLRRLAELTTGGSLRLTDDTRLDPEAPVEFEAALGQSHEVEGLLALLRSLAAELAPAEQRAAILRGLLTPELDQGSFDERLREAERSERECSNGLANP
jgi:hypothetical protein